MCWIVQRQSGRGGSCAARSIWRTHWRSSPSKKEGLNETGLDCGRSTARGGRGARSVGGGAVGRQGGRRSGTGGEAEAAAETEAVEATGRGAATRQMGDRRQVRLRPVRIHRRGRQERRLRRRGRAAVR